MDTKLLTSQLLLMSHLAEKYFRLIPQADWSHLINLATDKDAYITNIIESDTRPRGQIVDERKAKLKKQRTLRKDVNCLGQVILTQNEKSDINQLPRSRAARNSLIKKQCDHTL